MRTAEGFIFLNFSRDKQPPDFESDVRGVRTLGHHYGTAGLKIGARIHYPTKANWKLALENFLECYHCGPAHRSLVTTHDWDYSISTEQKARREQEIDKWVPPQVRPGQGVPPPQQNGAPQRGGGMTQAGGTSLANRGWLMPRFRHRIARRQAGGAAAAHFQGVHARLPGGRDVMVDGVLGGVRRLRGVARFIPRGVASTDAEIIWLVNPTAVAGKDFQVERLTALWDITMREDKWIVENNHQASRVAAGTDPDATRPMKLAV